MNVSKLFSETFKLNPQQQREIVQGGIESLFTLPAGWYGDHWKLSKVEAEDITKSVLLCLATLPKAQAKQWLALFNKYFPWFGLTGIFFMTVYPRVQMTRMMIDAAEQKRQRQEPQQPSELPTVDTTRAPTSTQQNSNGSDRSERGSGSDNESDTLIYQAPFAHLFR